MKDKNMEIVKEAINTDQVVNIQDYNMKPVYYLKFFGGNIKVKTSNWKKKKLEERYYLYDVTNLVRLSEGFIYDDKSDYIDERFIKESILNVTGIINFVFCIWTIIILTSRCSY